MDGGTLKGIINKCMLDAKKGFYRTTDALRWIKQVRWRQHHRVCVDLTACEQVQGVCSLH